MFVSALIQLGFAVAVLSHPTIHHQRDPTPTTLQAGQYWIRAVESPNFHKYLQTKPANTAATALLDDYTTAGQFNIIDGQLVEFTGASSAPLYLNVAKPANASNPPRTLATTFNSTKNGYGTFAFQGDAVTWSTPDFQRQNTAAWLVCAGQALFINTGAYGYQTPSGCADETVSIWASGEMQNRSHDRLFVMLILMQIHYYNGATAVN